MQIALRDRNDNPVLTAFTFHGEVQFAAESTRRASHLRRARTQFEQQRAGAEAVVIYGGFRGFERTGVFVRHFQQDGLQLFHGRPIKHLQRDADLDAQLASAPIGRSPDYVTLSVETMVAAQQVALGFARLHKAVEPPRPQKRQFTAVRKAAAPAPMYRQIAVRPKKENQKSLAIQQE
jgi:hypothetical protein